MIILRNNASSPVAAVPGPKGMTHRAMRRTAGLTKQQRDMPRFGSESVYKPLLFDFWETLVIKSKFVPPDFRDWKKKECF